MDDADLDAALDAGLRLLGIPIRPEWRDSIRFYFATNEHLALTVAAFELPDEADPAPVFRP